MKDLKNLSGALTAIIAVIAVRYIIKKIGIENIPIEIQMIFLILSPILIGIAIYKFSANSNISKHLVIAGIIFAVAIISLILLMIVKERYPQYFDLMRIPMALLFILSFLGMLIVLIIGLGKHKKK